MPRNKILFLTIGLLLIAVLGQSQCFPIINEIFWVNDDVTVETASAPGRTYQWSTNYQGCTITPNGNRAVVHRPPNTAGGVSVKVTQVGCTDSSSRSLTTNLMTTFVPMIGDTIVCGANPVQYECTWHEGPGNAAYYGHTVQVTGGILVWASHTSLPNYYWHDVFWVYWGAGPTGSLTSQFFHMGFPMGTRWTQNIHINCGFSGNHFPCVGTPAGFQQDCSTGGSYNWSSTNGTIVSGQSTDSVQIVWNTTGVDTVVSIFSSTNCGLDTNYFPVNILAYPTNVIYGDTNACENALDTFTTSLLPVLSPPGVTKVWQVTGGGLNILSSPHDTAYYTHGPGPLETVVLTTDDHGCIFRDTMTVHIQPAPIAPLPLNPVICTGDSLLLDAGPGYTSYAWSTGASTSAIFASAAIPYTVSVTDPIYNCLGATTVTPIIEPDCVWPGDANHDYIVDANDFLDIGVAFGDTGPLRANATTNWSGQPASDWINSFVSGENFKHADCDGDGVVDYPDTLSVSFYQGLTHARIGEVTTGVPLRIRPRIPMFAGQDSVELIVELGDPNFFADSAYGLAFQMDYSSNDVFPAISGKALTSFLGIPGNDYMSMDQALPNGSQFQIAMVRTDHQPMTGYGEVCRIHLQAKPSLWSAQTKVQLPINLSHCQLIKPDGTEIAVSPMADTIWLYDLGYVAVPVLAADLQWSVSPQPATDDLLIRIDGQPCGAYEASLADLSGKVVALQSGNFKQCGATNELDFDLRDLEGGVYALRISTTKFAATKRVVILR